MLEDSIHHNYDIKTILESHIWLENDKILPSFTA